MDRGPWDLEWRSKSGNRGATPSVYDSLRENAVSKLDVIKNSNVESFVVLFSYGEASCEIYENLHRSKISCLYGSLSSNLCLHSLSFLHSFFGNKIAKRCSL